jgi:UbiD family decarboxylase
LKRVAAEVNPELEITEIMTRVARDHGPAVLFEHVAGSPYPLLINMFGTARRVEMALGRAPEAIGNEMAGLLEKLNPPTPKNLLAMLGQSRRLFAMRAPVWGRGPVQQVVESAPDLTTLPR